ncbi:MAG: hypothetical protein A3J69_02845 [Candidatus Levybacteria bacterium RIFCSPHIGHO2_02_FULL_42_12]|nr:MAG: hypothetical protein A3J69_02845 [Candidatus Levybacteria bacterium RIFCSPHIGHO2_02_FULL_42_12]OGH42816.1 MAG: hypothetical protein A3B53_00185 [Candidatus Levybacteria bacterium RIFCSPLOWO2_01_FULL_42_15]
MTSLARVTSLSKKILAGLAILLILLVLYATGIRIKELLFPSPLPPPTVSFGKLPALFLETGSDNQNVSYELDTLSGIFPALPSQTKVYKFASVSGGLLSVQRAFEKANAIGFLSKGQKISETIYQWKDNSLISRILTFDVVFSTFDVFSNFLSEDQVYEKGSLSADNAKQKAKEFMQTLYGFPQDIDESKTKTTPLVKENGELIEAKSVANSQFFRVDFYQKDEDGIPIVYREIPFSSLNITVFAQSPFITEAHFPYRSITDEWATYPLKSPQEAFDDLKNGKAYVSSYDGDSQNIKIKEIKLAYLGGRADQGYLLPIILFEGQNGFIAFVSAISNQWTE